MTFTLVKGKDVLISLSTEQDKDVILCFGCLVRGRCEALQTLDVKLPNSH